MAISKNELTSLRHPSEESRFYITLFILLPLAVLVAVITVASFGLILIYVPFILFAIWFSTRLFLAQYTNNSILVSNKSFPKVYAAIQDAQELFGYEKEIEAFVYQNGDYNAAIVALLKKKVLLINSELVSSNEQNDEMRFIVGRFVGALASKHYRFSWLEVFLNSIERLIIFNLFLYPYERALQYSGDQLGLYFVSGNIDDTVSVIIKLTVGSDVAHKVDVAGFIEQGTSSRGSFFVWLTRAFSSFPHLNSRVVNLYRFGLEKFPEETVQSLNQASDEARAIIQFAIK